MLVKQAIKFCRNAIRGLLRARKSRKHDVCVSKRVLFFEYTNSNEWSNKVAEEFYDE